MNRYDNNNDESDDFVKYMNEISDINHELDQYESITRTIEQKQNSLIHEISEEQEEFLRRQVDSLVSEASSLQLSLKNKLKNVKTLAAGDRAKDAQAENCKDRFLQLIQEYRKAEANYKEANRIQAERQYRIVKPEASDSEVKEAIEDVGGQQIFSTALLNANRRGEAKTALQEVQTRHRELQKLEKTMAELTQLFNDMEQLVAEQDAPLQQVDRQVEDAQQDIEQGVGHTDKAVISARKARRKKCWCFWIIVVIICIIVAVVVGSVVGTRR